jgi:hypothetical protein
MPRVGYHQQIREAIDNMLIADSDRIAPVMYRYLGRLREGAFAHDIVDAIVQKTNRNPLDIYDACIFAQIWLGLQEGHIVLFRVGVDYPPFPDAQTKDINLVLEKLSEARMGISHPTLQAPLLRFDGCLRGEFIGGTSIKDGIFTWTNDIPTITEMADGNRLEATVPRRTVPLEVGTTQSATTVYHLTREGCLARWPYGSKMIYVFYCRRKWALWDQPEWNVFDDVLAEKGHAYPEPLLAHQWS